VGDVFLTHLDQLVPTEHRLNATTMSALYDYSTHLLIMKDNAACHKVQII